MSLLTRFFLWHKHSSGVAEAYIDLDGYGLLIPWKEDKKPLGTRDGQRCTQRNLKLLLSSRKVCSLVADIIDFFLSISLVLVCLFIVFHDYDID